MGETHHSARPHQAASIDDGGLDRCLRNRAGSLDRSLPASSWRDRLLSHVIAGLNGLGKRYRNTTSCFEHSDSVTECLLTREQALHIRTANMLLLV